MNEEGITKNEFFFCSFALLVHDNMNLQEMFPENVMNNLEIENGNMIFHYNRKLCYHKIKEFEDKVKMKNKSRNDISKSTNGDQMPCKTLFPMFVLEGLLYQTLYGCPDKEFSWSFWEDAL